jgi:hypothetical protein
MVATYLVGRSEGQSKLARLNGLGHSTDMADAGGDTGNLAKHGGHC